MGHPSKQTFLYLFFKDTIDTICLCHTTGTVLKSSLCWCVQGSSETLQDFQVVGLLEEQSDLQHRVMWSICLSDTEKVISEVGAQSFLETFYPINERSAV